MKRLHGVIRSYAWGSHTVLAELTGRPSPSDRPEAELWLGAHPADPAHVDDAVSGVSLLDVISADPLGQLGAANAERFRGRLPFLLKVLAADEPLSLQAHPNAVQAREGFERENASGVPLDSPARNYKDDNHKPELVVALTKFEALAGFRDVRRTVALLRALGVAELNRCAEQLEAQTNSSGIRALFTQWITGDRHPATLIGGVVEGCRRYLSTMSDGADGEFAAEAQTALELGSRYPNDPGVLISLLLNRITLEPGEGLFLAAGNLHAYLRGAAVEIMANSDNVLRGGLTPKHVDVPELLNVLDFRPAPMPVLGADGVDPDLRRLYRTPEAEFELTRLKLDTSRDDGSSSAATLAAGDPRIVLCTAGSTVLSSQCDSLELSAGQSAWLPASNPAVTLAPAQQRAQVFVARSAPSDVDSPRRQGDCAHMHSTNLDN
ncbi:mannose-6-phosphate isomerase [Rhodococcus jostii RHA1]|uniref:mannose-6-phosphate isomerase n=1 Tax=Rhodococcus jostii (strain RHA1) TaxID=101510 RepID=Q0S5H0_RHOJR|nr:mannose-6-phosphate isomerase, class I [Rhodococcus jostii]ABG97216.1 mannose-6-phosphate isomerase [Rhodococcus jostii RHA1]